MFHQSDVHMCKAYPGLQIIILPDGSRVMSYQEPSRIAEETIELLDLANEPISVAEPEVTQVPQTEAVGEAVSVKTKRNVIRRKTDPTFSALSEQEKQTKLREEIRSPIDVPKEAIAYLNSLGGNGRDSPRNVFINTMQHLTRDQKNCLMTNIRQYELKRSKKFKEAVTELANKP